MSTKPCEADHGEYREGCHVCWLGRHSVKHQILWGLTISTATTDRLPPATRNRIDKPNAGFNASHLPGLLAWRTGWAGSEIHVNDRTLRDLRHPRAGYGREDPRLFRFRDRLHVAFTGVEGGQGPTSQLYARLSDDLRVEKVYYPHYKDRRGWEKNWGFFEYDSGLYAVYSIKPHVVLHVTGDRATKFSEIPTGFQWSGGELKGGAPPVRVGDYFYGWFHGNADVDNRRRYNVGLYKFEAKPPFRPVAMTPDPLLWADPETCPKDIWADVVFPGGATLEDGVWTVSCGVHDRWIEMMTWRHADVEPLLARPGVRRSLPCLHLSSLVRKAGCSCPRKDTYLCGKGHGEVQPIGACETCPDYEADD